MTVACKDHTRVKSWVLPLGLTTISLCLLWVPGHSAMENFPRIKSLSPSEFLWLAATHFERVHVLRIGQFEQSPSFSIADP